MLIYERGSVTFQNKKARLLTLLKFVFNCYARCCKHSLYSSAKITVSLKGCVSFCSPCISYQITAQPCMESAKGGMESFQRNVWNQDRRVTKRYTLSRDAMRGQAAIPYNSQRELMPYQSLRAWINKKTNQSSSFYFGGPSRTRT